MLSRRSKELFYTFLGPAMKANSTFYRKVRAPRIDANDIFVHLGPGQRNYIEGWINVDANVFTAKADVWADLSHGIPFRDESVDAIYSHHVIEHLPNLQSHFHEMYRCLRQGGVFRIAGPNGDHAIRKFIDGDSGWFNNFPDKRESIGGKLDNFIFCRGEHLSLLTFSYLDEVGTVAGFEKINLCETAKETEYPNIFHEGILRMEREGLPFESRTIVVEGRKPYT